MSKHPKYSFAGTVNVGSIGNGNTNIINMINGSIAVIAKKKIPSFEETHDLLKFLLCKFYKLMLLDYSSDEVLMVINQMGGKIQGEMDHSCMTYSEKCEIAENALGGILHTLCTIAMKLNVEYRMISMKWYFDNTKRCLALQRDEDGEISITDYEEIVTSLIPVYFQLAQLTSIPKDEIIGKFRSMIEYALFLPTEPNSTREWNAPDILEDMMHRIIDLTKDHNMDAIAVFKRMTLSLDREHYV